MNITKATNLSCPLDGLPLSVGERQWLCQNGHSFDVARQGHVNLLPVQHKRSKDPGDSPEMIQARTAFLNSGAYAAIAEHLNEMIHTLITTLTGHEVCVLDAGCGEGYYLEKLLLYLQQAQGAVDVSLVGLDISKPAILSASKRSKQITWLVASNRQPPLIAGSVDLILCLFGFPLYESFSKLLRPGGRIILVESGPEHLLELRNIIYPTVNIAPPPALDEAEAAGFALCDQSELSYTVRLDSNSQVMNLLYMTPHYYRASHEGKQAAHQLEAIELTVDVAFRVLEHRSG